MAATKKDKPTYLSLKVPDSHFEEMGIVGMVCALPPHKLVHHLNLHLDFDFVREPDHNLVRAVNDTTIFFPYFTYEGTAAAEKFTLVHLVNAKGILMPELRKTDYLLLIKAQEACDAAPIWCDYLTKLPFITFANVVDGSMLKNKAALAV
jgi:hypothetical protein